MLQQRGNAALTQLKAHQSLGAALLDVVQHNLFREAKLPTLAHALQVLLLIPGAYIARESVCLLGHPQLSAKNLVRFLNRPVDRRRPVAIVGREDSARPQDAPRGMEFLYSLNRLNVATSRAKCLAIIVASPELFEPECQSPDQMKLANALCRFREMATRLDLAASGGQATTGAPQWPNLAVSDPLAST